MNRRKVVLGATAALAAAAGVGVAWWQQGREARAGATNRQPAISTGAAASTSRLTDSSPELLRDFWAMSFDSPDGQGFAMGSLRGKPLLVNFWATWCPPCIEELPLLDSFYRANQSKGWQVVGLAVDQPTAVKKWLQSKPLSFPVGLAGFQGTELVKSFGNASGSLPFTLVVNAAGLVLARKTGKVTADELQQWVLQG